MKDIQNYEGLYAVTEEGKVWGYPKEWLVGYGSKVTKKGSWLKIPKASPYERIRLCKSGFIKTYLLHRIIAQTFIPNPLNLPEVNHKNGIKDDNRVENLEWCTRSENLLHCYKTNLRKPISTAAFTRDISGKFIKVH